MARTRHHDSATYSKDRIGVTVTVRGGYELG
jgi:hypothetical protein